MSQEKSNKILDNARLIVAILVIIGGIFAAVTFLVKDKHAIEYNRSLIVRNKNDILVIKSDYKDKEVKFHDFTKQVLISLSELKTDIKYLTKK